MAYEPYAGKSGQRVGAPTELSKNLGAVLSTLAIMLGIALPSGIAVQLMQDPAFHYFVGSIWPLRILAACASFCGLLLVIYLICPAPAEGLQGGSKRVPAAAASCGVFGVVLLFSAGPLERSGFEARAALLACQSSPLFSYWEELARLRAQPSCSEQLSVEFCPGFKAALPLTDIAKQLESTYRCSGFCTSKTPVEAPLTVPSKAAPAAAEVKAPQAPWAGVAAVQTKATFRQRPEFMPLNRVMVSAERPQTPRFFRTGFRERRQLELEQELQRNQAQAHGSASFLQTQTEAHETDGSHKYMPGLFTLENMNAQAGFPTSCDAAASFAIEKRSITSGNVLFMEGIALLLVSLSLAVTTATKKAEPALEQAM